MSSVMLAGGGLDVDYVVTQLIYAERAPARDLQRARDALKGHTSALDQYESKLKSLKDAIAPLRSTAAINARTATSSDSNVVTASAAAGTRTGTFQLEVTQLASTHSVASAGFSSLEDLVPEGTFDIRVGNGAATTLTVTAGMTIEDLRDEIAAAGVDLDAVVLFDGTNYRLSLTSGQSGANGAITADNFSNGSLQSALGFSQTSAARDATFQLNGLTMTRGSNQVSDAVTGATFEMKSLGVSTVNISADPEKVVESVRAFVDSYNSLTNLVKSQLASGKAPAGPLAKMSSVRGLQEQLRSLVTRGVPGGDITTLRQMGVELQNDGSLKVDDAKLRTAAEDHDLSKFFKASNSTSDSRLIFGGTTSATQQGTYEVFITQAAEKAAVTSGSKVPNGGLRQDETLTFTKGAVSVDVQLTEDMTIDEVVSTINSALAGTGIDVVASDDGQRHLVLTSSGYGSNATIDVTSNTDANGATGVGTAGLIAAGIDVAGTIGGAAATGTGRALIATAGDPQGMSVEVRVDPGEIGPGGSAIGNLTHTRGMAESLGQILERELSSTGGRLAAERTGIKKSDQLLEDRIESIDRRLAARQVFLTQQFSRADQALRKTQALLQSIQLF